MKVKTDIKDFKTVDGSLTARLLKIDKAELKSWLLPLEESLANAEHRRRTSTNTSGRIILDPVFAP